MSWLSIVYFFVVTFLLGTLVDAFVVHWRADWLEKAFMRIGVGLASMSVLGVVLNLFRIPLDYRFFFGIGVLIALVAAARNKAGFSLAGLSAWQGFWRRKSFWYGLIVLVLFAVTVQMHLSGAFSYDYLEDTDPWGYTAVADYIGENRTFSVPYYATHYSEPYTQGYQIVMGVLSQTNMSIYWTMKFFSALIVSFGVPFMYYFARHFSRDEDTAILSAFFLFAVPAWVTHFVYSLHFNMIIFVVLLYVLAHLMREPSGVSEEHAGWRHTKLSESSGLYEAAGWMPVGVIVYASMLVNHFSSVFQGTIFFLAFLMTRILVERKIDWKTVQVLAGGFLVSLLFYVPAYSSHWWVTQSDLDLGGVFLFFPLARAIVNPGGLIAFLIFLAALILLCRSRILWEKRLYKWLDGPERGLKVWLILWGLAFAVLLQPFFTIHSLGTGTIDYEIKHFFSASSSNLMNNPIGLGFVLMTAVFVSFFFALSQLKFLFKKENAWIAISLTWAMIAFILVLGEDFSIAIAPFRAWTFLGFIASLFAAWGCVAIIRKLTRRDFVLFGVLTVLAAVVVPTSVLPKYELNTMVWRDHMVGNERSRALYAWMREEGIPKNSVVASLCGNSVFLSGYDMNPPLWNQTFNPEWGIEPPYFMSHPLRLTPEAFGVLNDADVEYVTFGASCIMQAPKERQDWMRDLVARKIGIVMNDERLVPVRNTGSEYLLKLN